MSSIVRYGPEDIGKWVLSTHAVPNREGKLVLRQEWRQIQHEEEIDMSDPPVICAECRHQVGGRCTRYAPPQPIPRDVDEPYPCCLFQEVTI